MWKIVVFLILLLSIQPLFPQGGGDTVRAVAIDNQNVKWFGTDLGLLRFDGAEWTAYATRSDHPGKVTSLISREVSNGPELWIGTDNGVSAATSTADGISSATRYHSGNSLLESNSIVDITMDSSNTRYFATPIGVGVFEKDEWTWLEKGWGPADSGIPNYELLSLGAKNDTVYIGAINRGAGRLINEVDGFSGASYYEIPWSGIVSNSITSIYTDKQGYQWFGSVEGVSYHTHQDGRMGWELTLSTNDGLVNNHVNAIFEDTNGDYWIATDGGVSRFRKKSLEFTNYTTAEGLSDNMVFDIGEDQENILWFATANGVSSFDGETFVKYPTGEHAKDFVQILTNINLPSENRNTNILTAYPNPANADLFIHYYKEAGLHLTISIFDISGKLIRDIYNEYAGEGDLKVRWNLSDHNGKKVQSGIYFVVCTSQLGRTTEKIILF